MLRIYSVALELIRGVRPLIEQIERSDADLARQCRRALSSVPLNVAEGSASQGKNQNARYYNARGSAREARACFETAWAFGYIEKLDAANENRFSHVIGTLVRVLKLVGEVRRAA